MPRMSEPSLVFHSENVSAPEVASFAGARFLTLLAENTLLWLSIDLLGVAAIPAKLLVSIVQLPGITFYANMEF